MPDDEKREMPIALLPIHGRMKGFLFDKGWWFVGDICDRPEADIRRVGGLGEQAVFVLRRALLSVDAPGTYVQWPAYERWQHHESAPNTRYRLAPTMHYQSVLWPQVYTDGRHNGWAWVYFIRSGGHLKIGSASDLMRRYHNLQTANPNRLSLWLAERHRTISAAFDEEALLHRTFAPLRVRGEWFRIDGSLARFVRDRRRNDAARHIEAA